MFTKLLTDDEIKKRKNRYTKSLIKALKNGDLELENIEMELTGFPPIRSIYTITLKSRN
jgi:hypothetical protein